MSEHSISASVAQASVERVDEGGAVFVVLWVDGKKNGERIDESFEEEEEEDDDDDNAKLAGAGVGVDEEETFRAVAMLLANPFRIGNGSIINVANFDAFSSPSFSPFFACFVNAGSVPTASSPLTVPVISLSTLIFLFTAFVSSETAIRESGLETSIVNFPSFTASAAVRMASAVAASEGDVEEVEEEEEEDDEEEEEEEEEEDVGKLKPREHCISSSRVSTMY